MVTLIRWIGMVALVKGSQDVVIREEVCIWETFKTRCANWHMFDILSSVYGRFYETRCAAILNDTQPRYECSTDVLTFVKSQCDGTTFCQIPLPDQRLDNQSIGCSRSELQSLKISYSCHKDEELNTAKTVVTALFLTVITCLTALGWLVVYRRRRNTHQQVNPERDTSINRTATQRNRNYIDLSPTGESSSYEALGNNETADETDYSADSG